MKSKEIFPEYQRLDNLQVIELEGFKSKGVYGDRLSSFFNNISFSKDELLLKYHKALLEAEKEILRLDDELYKTKVELNDFLG